MKKAFVNVGVLILGLFFISCNRGNDGAENQFLDSKPKVVIYDYQIWSSDLDRRDLQDSITVYIDTFTYNNRMYYGYTDSLGSDSSYYDSFSTQRDSFFYYHDYCKTLDTVVLHYKNDKIELIKSDFDIEHSIDEECHIYWSKTYGLIGVYNYPWKALILFENEEIEGFANETFYEYIVNQIKEKQ
ncbi:MAG: hypothetical protein GX857_07120 [Bacteroidales bacterium]|nr:hypothetical protein [Bacteroidales bacterium]